MILVRVETSPEDIHGMHAAEGILTTRGGMTATRRWSRAAWASPASPAPARSASTTPTQTMTAGGVDAEEGRHHHHRRRDGRGARRARCRWCKPELTGDFATLMDWADAVRRMKVRANAETPLDARTAREFGAEGIGLCRTEHMFFEGERIVAVREMILADDEAGRRAALAKLLPMQRQDFVELFEIMTGLPVTIRLLDPPLHEFLPHTDAEIAEVAEGDGRPRRQAARARQRAARVQPDARLPRLRLGDRAIPRSTRCRRARSSRAPSRPAARPARRSRRRS